jgi:hypothetical protein
VVPPLPIVFGRKPRLVSLLTSRPWLASTAVELPVVTSDATRCTVPAQCGWKRKPREEARILADLRAEASLSTTIIGVTWSLLTLNYHGWVAPPLKIVFPEGSREAELASLLTSGTGSRSTPSPGPWSLIAHAQPLLLWSPSAERRISVEEAGRLVALLNSRRFRAALIDYIIELPVVTTERYRHSPLLL